MKKIFLCFVLLSSSAFAQDCGPNCASFSKIREYRKEISRINALIEAEKKNLTLLVSVDLVHEWVNGNISEEKIDESIIETVKKTILEVAPGAVLKVKNNKKSQYASISFEMKNLGEDEQRDFEFELQTAVSRSISLRNAVTTKIVGLPEFSDL